VPGVQCAWSHLDFQNSVSNSSIKCSEVPLRTSDSTGSLNPSHSFPHNSLEVPWPYVGISTVIGRGSWDCSQLSHPKFWLHSPETQLDLNKSFFKNMGRPGRASPTNFKCKCSHSALMLHCQRCSCPCPYFLNSSDTVHPSNLPTLPMSATNHTRVIEFKLRGLLCFLLCLLQPRPALLLIST
jgi:hypothetical protein